MNNTYYFYFSDKTIKCKMDSLNGSPAKKSEEKQQCNSLKDVNKIFLNVH